MKNKLRIVSSTWHIMHQYDLANALADDAEFYFILNTWRDWKDERFSSIRAIPKNVHFVPYYEKGKYDFAILDIDQQLCNPNLGKYKVYKQLNEVISDIPKVVINHGSPIYPEFLKYAPLTDEDAKKKCKELISELVGDNLMVTNSYQAAKEWGWGYPIWHGISPIFCDLPKEPRVFSALSPAGLDCYYNRMCMNETIRILKEKYDLTLYWARVNKMFSYFEQYRDFLGRSLIYFDPSIETPMNRARAEAMHSGCCIVQVKGGHDLERFANSKNEKNNMILVENDPEICASTIADLILNRYDEAVKIGQEGKKTAEKLFNLKIYRQRWLKFIKENLRI